MARRGLLAILLLFTACATYPSVPMRPAPELTLAPEVPPAEAPPPPPPEPLVVPPQPPVTENLAFTTVNNVPLYRIAPRDILDVVITRGFTQERQTVTVRSDGTVTVSLATVSASGLTVEETADRLREALALYFRDPRVEVAVKEYVSRRVTILGAVGSPTGKGGQGVYELRGRLTLNDGLAVAGGVLPHADLENVHVTRADGIRIKVNLSRMILSGELQRDVVLDDRDTVYVPSLPPAAAAMPERVFVFGEARNPGGHPFTPKMRLTQAMALAGGITDTGLAQSVRVIRGNLDNPEIIETNFEKLLVEGDRTQDVALQPNDIVVIPRTGVANWNAFLAKIRPTLEFLTLGTATVTSGQNILIQQRTIDRGATSRGVP